MYPFAPNLPRPRQWSEAKSLTRKATSRAVCCLAALLAGLALAIPARAQSESATSYMFEEGFASGPLTLTARVFRPTGSTPAPAVIVLHDCSGPNEATFAWARRVASWGYVAIVPDSFGPRGKNEICGNPTALLPRLRVPDVLAAADLLPTLPYVDPGRVALLGFAHGAGTVMEALQDDLSATGIKGGIAYYPLCIPDTHRQVAQPLLLLIGEADDWTPATQCRALEQAGFRRPGLVEVVYYTGAHHGFDIDRPAATVSGAQLSPEGALWRPPVPHRIAYDPVAARDAEARTRALLDRLLR